MIKSFNTPAMQARRAQAGITLIEVSIGLIIAAIIAAAAFLAFQNNQRRSETRENIANITEVTAEIKNKFFRTDSFGALSAQTAEAAGVLEPIGGTPTNTYGGAVTIAATQITWGAVPSEQCVDVALGVESGYSSVLIGAGGQEVKGTAIATVQAACEANDTPKDLVLVF